MPTEPTTSSTETAADARATTIPVLSPVATAIGTSPVLTTPIATSPVLTTPVTTLPINPIGTLPVTTIPITPITPVPTGGSATALSPTNPKVTTTAPTSSVAVTVPNTSGQVTFSLVVTDNLGVVSQPSTVTVTIQSAPVAVLRAASPTVAAGAPIQLSADASTSSGSIASYTFSLVTPS